MAKAETPNSTKYMTLLLIKRVAAVVAAFCLGATAHAQTITSQTTGGDWSQTSTWVGGTAIPGTADDVLVTASSGGSTVSITADAGTIQTLTLGGTTSGILNFNIDANLTLTTAASPNQAVSMDVGSGTAQAIVSQTAGVVTLTKNPSSGTLLSGNLRIGYTSATGTIPQSSYTITGGSLSGVNLIIGAQTTSGTVGGNGAFYANGGTVNFSSAVGIGNGLLSVGGGVMTASSTITMLTSSSALSVSSGTLNAMKGIRMQRGTATVSGGTLNISSYYYSAAGGLVIGDTSTANFYQTGGTVNLLSGGLDIASSSGQTGTYSMSGGILDMHGSTNANGVIVIGNYYNATSGTNYGGRGSMTLSGTSQVVNAKEVKLGMIIGQTSARSLGNLTLLGNSSLATLATGTVSIYNGALTVTDSATLSTNVLALSTNTTTSGVAAVATMGGSSEVSLGTSLDISGGTVNLNGGTLALQKFNFATGSSSNVINFNGTTVKVNGSTGGANFLAPGAVATTLNVQSGGAIFDTNGYDAGISGALSGVGGVTKQGSGTLTLSNTHSYTGTTNVNGGRLVVNGNIATSATQVNSGGMLAGVGTLGSVTVNSGGTFSAGQDTMTAGVTNLGNLDLGANGTMLISLTGIDGGASNAGVSYSMFSVTGTANLGGLLDVELNGLTLTQGSYYFVLSNDGTDAITGAFTNVSGNQFTADGQLFQVYYNADFATNSLTGGNDIAIQAIPEPGVVALVMAGMGLMLIGCCKRKRTE